MISYRFVAISSQKGLLSLRHPVDSQEYRINHSFNCDSSNVVYLSECTVCGVQYVGSTCTPLRLRFNNYKACSRKFN